MLINCHCLILYIIDDYVYDAFEMFINHMHYLSLWMLTIVVMLNLIRVVLCEFSFYLYVLPLICRCHGKSGEFLRLLYMLNLKTGFQFHKAGNNCYLHFIYHVVEYVNECQVVIVAYPPPSSIMDFLNEPMGGYLLTPLFVFFFKYICMHFSLRG